MIHGKEMEMHTTTHVRAGEGPGACPHGGSGSGNG